MRSSFTRSLRLTAVLPLALAAACGGDDASGDQPDATEQPAGDTDPGGDTDAGNGDTGNDGGTFPATVEHAFGETVIDAEPERVVTVGWASHDTVVALGIVPVAVPVDAWAGGDDGLLPWLVDGVEALGGELPRTYTDMPELDIDAVLAANPDVIIATYSGIDQATYDQLSSVAPTVAYPDQPWIVSWQDQTRLTAAALGRPAAGDALVDEIESKIDAAGDTNPELDGLTFAYVFTGEPGTLSIYLPGDPRVDVLTGLGMEPAAFIDDLDFTPGTFWSTIGLENADLLDDVDVLITWFNDAAQQTELEAQPLFAQIPAVERGSYLPVLDRELGMATSTVTALGIDYALENYVPMVVDAAAQVG